MNVLQQIADWADGLPYWEQAALDLIVRGVPIAEEEINALLTLLLEDADLAPKTSPRRPSTIRDQLASLPAGSPPPRLVALENLQNINALAERQILSFGSALTAIYGGNGSGKSGYARVLGCAGFTRGDREVLPDVTKPYDDATVLSASILIAWNGDSQTINYRIGQRCPELSAFYVFDSTSVRVHLCESSPLSFSPAGLSFLTALADLTDTVRSRLQLRIEEASQPNEFPRLFSGPSEVATLISDLGPSSDPVPLEQLAVLSESQRQRLSAIDLEIAQLKARDIPRETARLQQEAADLEGLALRLDTSADLLSQASFEALRRSSDAAEEQHRVAQTLSAEQFRTPALTQVGSEEWYRFAMAARALAETEARDGEPYPQQDAACLLCQQPLSPEARSLLTRLWQFLEGEAQARLTQLEADYASRLTNILETPLDLLSEDSVAYRHLLEADKALLSDARQFLDTAAARRASATAIPRVAASQLAPLPLNPSQRIRALVVQLGDAVRKLQMEPATEQIDALSTEQRLLSHRTVLWDNLDEIKGYIARAAWVARAKEVGGSTAHITRFHNVLFSQVVTDRYIELFQDLLSRMGRSLKVKVVTRGRKGAVLKQIAVQADPTAPAHAATPEKVLSEGEKRAVALADFLTEVALDTSSSGIVLDDPVTSLDIEWRELIAAILACEASRRQVIVFTHDLPFLYFLKREADKAGVPTSTHWIKRGEEDDKPGYVYLDNSPALEKDFRSASRSREFYSQALTAPPQQQEALLHLGFGALRTSYEAFVVFELFNEVVVRFGERIMFGNLKQVVVEPAIVDEVVETFERLSRFIEAHLHSDAIGAMKPTPAMLLSEIERFDALRRRQRDLKKG